MLEPYRKNQAGQAKKSLDLLLCKPVSEVLCTRYVLSDAPRQRMMREDLKH